MAIGIKTCKVCGMQYEACHTLRPNKNSEFRWQDVACSPEHGAEYLRRVMIARGQLEKEPVVQESAPTEEEAPAVEAPKKRSRRKAVKNEEAAEN